MTDDMVSIFFAGTAGAGKSTLVGTFQRWMDENGYNALTVNLDPGAEVLAFDADVDVREWLVLGQIMEQYNNNRLIRPLATYIGPEEREYIPLDER